jgi:hypothetical protein
MLIKVNTSYNTLQALCLTPTRELAQQIISDAIVRLSTRLGFFFCESGLGLGLVPLFLPLPLTLTLNLTLNPNPNQDTQSKM